MNVNGPDVTTRPNVLLVVFSWLVVVGCICLGSFAVAGLIARTWDPCAWVSGVMFGGGALLLGVMQFRGTFRRDRNAATLSMVILYACGGFVVFSTVVCSGE